VPPFGGGMEITMKFHDKLYQLKVPLAVSLRMTIILKKLHLPILIVSLALINSLGKKLYTRSKCQYGQ